MMMNVTHRLSGDWSTRMQSAALFLLVALPVASSAQPSGGPYGPVSRTYALPGGGGKAYYVAVDGKPEIPGESLAGPTTIESAIRRARTGDAIVLRGGTYRTGNLKFNQGITIQPYTDEKPVLKGTAVASTWENLGNSIWSTRWTRLFPARAADWWRRNREGKKTPPYRFNNDMVFVDGRFLQAVGWEGDVDENSYCIDYDAGVVYIGVDPTNRLVEITAYDAGLLRTTEECNGVKSDRKGFTLRGVTLTQYAYRAIEIEGKDPEGPSAEAEHGKDVVGTTIEDCTISFCSRVAGYFRGDRLTMRRCKISDTSTEGVYVIGSNDVLLERNIFTRNNIENITGYYPAAVKIFNQCYRVTCRDNLVTELPNSNGIWYDVGNVDGVFINNWVEGVGSTGKPLPTNQLWPSDNGFFFEISKGAICAGNVFVDCDHGVMVLNSADVQIYRNTFVNSTACIGRNGRVAAGDHFGWHASTGPDLEKRDGHIMAGNLFVGDKAFSRPLLFVWQPAEVCAKLPKQMLKQLDHNVFVRRTEKPIHPLILWSPATGDRCQAGFESAKSHHEAYPEFSADSRTLAGYDGPLFQSMELKNFRVVGEFPDSRTASAVPADVLRLLGWSKETGRHVGAYAPVQR